MVARVWPTDTCWPAVTSTAVTRPEAPKLRSAVLAGSTVPDEETVWVMVPVETVWTVVVVVTRGVALELLVASQVPNPAPRATTATTTMMMGPLRAYHRLRPRATDYLACRLAGHDAGHPSGVQRSSGPTGMGRPHPTGRTLTPGHSHLWGS